MPIPNNIDPDAKYWVRLKGVVQLAPGVIARPRDQVTVRGAKLLEIQDKVASAELA